MILRLVRRNGSTELVREAPYYVDPNRPPLLVAYGGRLYVKANSQFGRGWVAVYNETEPLQLDE